MQTEIEIEEKEREIRSQLRRAFIQLESQERTLEAAEAEAELARETWELTSEAREIGTASSLEVETALQQQYAAELALANARLDIEAQVYEIHRLAGLL